jgi:heptaprenyl diphosphate synthase
MKKVALNGLLISLALVLSFLERFIPLGLIVPIPGIKLGLANIVTMFALFYMGFHSASIITLLRCTLAALLFGGMSSLLFSLAGALLALLAMALLKVGYNKMFTLLGISIGGAALHNTGQILVASLMMRNTAVFAYLPILLLAAVFTGLLTAIISSNLFHVLEKSSVVNQIR